MNIDETFAPIAKMTMVQILLAIVASQTWPLFQMNVKKSFSTWRSSGQMPTKDLQKTELRLAKTKMLQGRDNVNEWHCHN